MPPRFAYWTILIDNAPTAFRARDPRELLPTLAQLKRTNANVVMKWFARGRLWESMEQEHEDFRQAKIREKRSRDWRPGGLHKDPRARFRKDERPRERPWGKSTSTSTPGPRPDRPKPDSWRKTDNRKPGSWHGPNRSRPSSGQGPTSRKPSSWSRPNPRSGSKQRPNSSRPASRQSPRPGQRPWQRQRPRPGKKRDDE